MTAEEAREQLGIIMDFFCTNCEDESCDVCRYLESINMASAALKEKTEEAEEIEIPIPLKWNMNNLQGYDKLAQLVALKQNAIIECITKMIQRVEDTEYMKGCEK